VGVAYHETELVAEERPNEIAGTKREATDGIEIVLRNLL
jgi:hypothetical protein